MPPFTSPALADTARSARSQTPEVVDQTAYVPLWSSTGQVRAYAIVDESSLPAIVGHRWRLGAGSNAITDVRDSTGARQILTMGRAVVGLPATGQPTVRHRNGNPLDNRRTNLALPRAGLVRALEASPEIGDVLLGREVQRVLAAVTK